MDGVGILFYCLVFARVIAMPKGTGTRFETPSPAQPNKWLFRHDGLRAASSNKIQLCAMGLKTLETRRVAARVNASAATRVSSYPCAPRQTREAESTTTATV